MRKGYTDRDGLITTEGWREEEKRQLHLSPYRAWTGGRAAAATGKGEARSRRCSGGGRSTIRPLLTPTRPAAGSGGSETPFLPPIPSLAVSEQEVQRWPVEPRRSHLLLCGPPALRFPSHRALRTPGSSRTARAESGDARATDSSYSAAPPRGERENRRIKTSGAILLNALWFFFFWQPVYLNTLFNKNEYFSRSS